MCGLVIRRHCLGALQVAVLVGVIDAETEVYQLYAVQKDAAPGLPSAAIRKRRILDIILFYRGFIRILHTGYWTGVYSACEKIATYLEYGYRQENRGRREKERAGKEKGQDCT